MSSGAFQAEHIVVIENGQPPADVCAAADHTAALSERGYSASRLKTRFGFFGQITEYKGVEILLQAIHLISPDARATMMFEIHGANLDWQAQ